MIRNADIDYTSTSIFCSKGQAYLVKGEEAKEHMHCLVLEKFLFLIWLCINFKEIYEIKI